MSLRKTIHVGGRLLVVVGGVGYAAVSLAAPPDKPVAPFIPPADTPSISAPEPVGKIVASGSASTTASADALPRMFAEAKTAMARVRDYVGHYIRQERVSGRLVPEETCELRVRVNPFSVAVKVVGPKEFAGRETCYIAGRSADRVKFKEAGKLAYLTLPRDDSRVLADTRHVITDVGLAAILERVEQAIRVEKQLNNPVQVLVSDYTFAGRSCKRYEIFADRPHAHRYAYRHVLFIDTDKKLPIRYEAYDQPKPGGTPGGELIETQSFVGLKFNVGLGEATFDR